MKDADIELENIWREYEQRKRELEEFEMTPEEYDAEIEEILQELGL